MRKHLTRALAVLFVALGFTAMTAAPAHASFETDYATQRDYSSSEKECFESTSGIYRACAQPYGDLLWIKDLYADGHGLTLRWEDLDGDRSGRCINDLGKATGWTACNKNFPEGHTIRWYIEYFNLDGERASGNNHYTDF